MDLSTRPREPGLATALAVVLKAFRARHDAARALR